VTTIAVPSSPGTRPDVVPVAKPGLDAAIARAAAKLRADQRGTVITTLTLDGWEVSIGQRGPMGGLFSGYAQRVWGGGWQAGARAQWEW
jgi:hypothetical protein